MKCHACGKEFTPLRSTAMFCSATCRKASSRVKPAETPSIEPKKISEPTPTVNDGPKFIPNWKLNGFKSADEGMLCAIGMLIGKKKVLEGLGLVDGVTVTWHGRSIML